MKEWKCWTAALALSLCLSHPAAAILGTELTLGTSSISFPNELPDIVPSIAASENPVNITVETPLGLLWNLTALASGDLISGANTIPINKVTWTATGTGFVSGTMSKTTAQSVGSGSGLLTTQWNGTLRFYLENSWSYLPGNYSQTVVFTLVAL